MSEVANIPQLRFSEFSGEWEEKKLGELCKFTQGVQIPFSEQLTKYKEGAIRYLYIRDFFTDDFPYYVKDQYPNKVIHTDEIMMVNTGNTAGKAFMGATGVLSNNAFKVSFDKTKVSNIFLFQRITSDTIQRRIKSFFNAGGQPHLGHKNIAIIPMGFASLKEQQKIAAFLTAVDNKIEQLSKKKELLGEYKKGLMQKIFSQAIRFKADDGGDYPDWEELKLGEVARFRRGSFPQPYGNPEWYDDEDGKPFVQVYDVAGNMRLKSTTKRKISVLAQSSSVFVPKGNVVLTIQGSIGRIALTQYDAYVDRTLLIFTGYIKEVNKQFFIYVIYLLFEIEKIKAPGGTIKTITKEALTSFKLDLPCFDEQTKIANFLSSIDSKIEQVGKQLDKSKQFKKALLQQMFV